MIRNIKEIENSGICGPVISTEDIKDTLEEMIRTVKTLDALGKEFGATSEYITLKIQNIQNTLNARSI